MKYLIHLQVPVKMWHYEQVVTGALCLMLLQFLGLKISLENFSKLTGSARRARSLLTSNFISISGCSGDWVALSLLLAGLCVVLVGSVVTLPVGWPEWYDGRWLLSPGAGLLSESRFILDCRKKVILTLLLLFVCYGG